MTVRLSSDDIETMLDQAISHMPPTRSDQHQHQMEQATETAVRAMAEPLMNGDAPDLMLCEERILDAMGSEAAPPWLVRSRVVLVFRDMMRDPDYRTAFDHLPRQTRENVLESWARLAADLFVSYPDKQISGRPDLALSILSGDDRDLKQYLSIELGENAPAPIRQAGFLSRLTGRKATAAPQQPSLRQSPGAPAKRSAPAARQSLTRPTAPAAAQNRFNAQQGVFNAKQGIKRVSGADRIATTTTQSTQPNRTAAPQSIAEATTMAKAPPRAQNEKMGPESFIGIIQEQFNHRGLPPISVGIATDSARIMTESVLHGRVPDFHEVEYEVMVRQGEGVAAGAVRTWTIHAFMECMRDPWFRDRYNALPSQARSEAVWIWARLAADWFDVPEKMREFWVRSLSGGDAVLAAAVSRAFAAKSPTAPMKSARTPTALPAAVNQLVEELEQREALQPADMLAPVEMPENTINTSIMNTGTIAANSMTMNRPVTQQNIGMMSVFGQPQSFDRKTPRAETSLSFPRPLNGQRLRVMSAEAGVPGNLPLGAAEIRYGSPD